MKIGKAMAGATVVLFLASAPTLMAHEKSKGKKKDKESTESRFRRLDVNNNGFIEFSEWSGDRTKFDRLDMNRDGVLSESELRHKKMRKGTGRFKQFDRDQNGVISRGEWPGNDQSFRTHDRNNDGVLSGSELKKSKGR